MTPFAPIIFSLQKLGYLKFRRVVASLQSNKAWNLDFVVIVQSGNKSNKLSNRVTVIVFVQKTSEQNKFKKKEIKNENSSLTRISPYRMCEQIANRKLPPNNVTLSELETNKNYHERKKTEARA